jgi:hypothetical protein
VGIPRSNLVKAKSAPSPALAPAVASPQAVNPFAATTLALPSPGPVSAPVASTAPAPVTSAAPAPVELASIDFDLEVEEPGAPSTHALLERAAQLGPMRPTLESIALPSDPILGEKMKPRVAERRARFTKLVKATVGACVAVCVAALLVSIVSGDPGTANAATRPLPGKTSPAVLVASVETLDAPTLDKAPRKAAAVAKASVPAKKARRSAKKRH